MTEAARAAGASEIRDDISVHAVCPCAGDDEWCVISICTDVEWRCAASVFGKPELVDDPRFATAEARRANRAELSAVMSAWTSARTPLQAAQLLQSGGVAAGPMNRPPDLLEDPQLAERQLFATMVHPLISRRLPAETGPAPFRHIPHSPRRPAPQAGQDTRTVCHELLEMSSDEIERLIAEGVLFGPAGG